MNRAIAYTRQSKSRAEDDGDSLSCAMQEHQIRQWASSHDYELVRVYSDQDISGRTDQRPGFQAMFDDLRSARDVQAVIAYKYSRFARRMRIFATYQGELADRGIELLSATESSDSRMVQVSALIADWYSTDLSEFTSAAIRHKIRRGAWHGQVPIGYVKDVPTQRLVIDPPAAAFVAELFDRYLAGETIQDLIAWGKTDPALAGFRDRWAWSRQTIHRLLGRRTYLGHTTGMDHAHPAIVTPEVFEAVQRKRRRPVRTRAKRITSPLEGMVTCGACGQRSHLAVVRETGRFFRCGSLRDYSQRGTEHPPHQTMYRADGIERATRERLMRDLAGAQGLDDALQMARNASRSDQADKRRSALMRQRGIVQAGRERLLGLFRDGRLDADRWETADREAAATLAGLDAGIAALPTAPDPAVYARAADLIQDAVSVIGITSDDPSLQVKLDAELRRLLIAMDAQVSIDPLPPLRGRRKVPPSVTIRYGDPYARFVCPP